ncbi:MAG: hypothetical protein Q4G66_10615 [bacterium]|nr:hypothetical protein [bacterium]
MHTDEYEISIAREIIVCKRFTEKLSKRLEEHAGRFGASDPDKVVRNNEQSDDQAAGTISEQELQQWREDIEALAIWEQRLAEYEEAFRMMRTSASS